MIEPEERNLRRHGRTRRGRIKGGKLSTLFQNMKIEVEDISIFNRRSVTLTIDDIRVVSSQLGYEPLNIVDVAGRENGIPRVAILFPLNRNESIGGRYASKDFLPFPTIIWMTCPLLKMRISGLEKDGWISKLENRLEGDDEAQLKMINAHNMYAEKRWNMLSLEDIELVHSRARWTDALRSTGIAGMRNFKSVKCLHCHYSHYLACPEHENIIGKWVHDLLVL